MTTVSFGKSRVVKRKGADRVVWIYFGPAFVGYGILPVTGSICLYNWLAMTLASLPIPSKANRSIGAPEPESVGAGACFKIFSMLGSRKCLSNPKGKPLISVLNTQ